jgi:hypothetical protein
MVTSRDSAVDVAAGSRGGGSALTEQWRRLGVAGGAVAVASYTAIAAGAPLTATQAAVVAALFGGGLACGSLGLHRVLQLRRHTISVDLGLLSNIAAAVTVTLMLFAQAGLHGWFDIQFGAGARDSTDPTLHAAFEAANGIQLGLDVAWDVLLATGTVLLAVNMWRHPMFGRALAGLGVVIAAALLAINLAVFPEPPGDAGAIDLGPFVGLWYLAVTVQLARCGRWVADVSRTRPT